MNFTTFAELAKAEYELDDKIEQTKANLAQITDEVNRFDGDDDEFDAMCDRESEYRRYLAEQRDELDELRGKLRSIRKSVGSETYAAWRAEFHADPRFPTKHVDVTMIPTTRPQDTAAYKRLVDIYSN
jgi:hypothetical protein